MRYPLVRRKVTEVINGRTYLPTASMKLVDEDGSGDTYEFDMLANMRLAVWCELPPRQAAVLCAQAYSRAEYTGVFGEGLGSISEFSDTCRTFVEAGIIGWDEHGGYFKTEETLAAGV